MLVASLVDESAKSNASVDGSTGFKFKTGEVSLDHFIGFISGGPVQNVKEEEALTVTGMTARTLSTSESTTQPTWEENFFQEYIKKYDLSVPLTALTGNFYNPKSPKLVQEGNVIFMDTGSSMFVITDTVVKELALPRLPSTCWFTTAANKERIYGQYVAVGFRLVSEHGLTFELEVAACTHPDFAFNLLSKTFLRIHNMCQAFDKFYYIN